MSNETQKRLSIKTVANLVCMVGRQCCWHRPADAAALLARLAPGQHCAHTPACRCARAPSIPGIAFVLQINYGNKDHLMAGMIIAGWDSEQGGQVRAVGQGASSDAGSTRSEAAQSDDDPLLPW
jgi:hypothetical protein